LISVRRAVLSVYDKEGLPEFASVLASLGVEIVSSGGTAALLRERGLAVTEVSDYTGSPEMLGGRVKTLHPRVFGGILLRRSVDGDLDEAREHGVLPIDLVVVNFYPFERAAGAGGSMSDADAAELIDIGGPSMVRAAAKNWEHVLVLTHPSQYGEAARRLERGGGKIDEDYSREMAVEAFRRTCFYDFTIAAELSRRATRGGSGAAREKEGEGSPFPEIRIQGYRKKRELRYGENPHQRAALYVEPFAGGGLAGAEPLHGKALSFNNLLDLQAAWDAVNEFDETACVVIKHRNPCGVAVGSDPAEAFSRARDADSMSAFGGVVAFNRDVSAEAAEALAGMFLECVVAPGFAEEALERLKKKKNLRLLRMQGGESGNGLAAYSLSGGLLLEDPDAKASFEARTVTEREPTAGELRDLRFAWAVAKHVTSNAIVLVRGGATVGIGSGQTSRVDALNVAVMKARRQGADPKGCVMASDGFFPFRDSVDTAHEVGVTAIVQPGGSVRDQESIDAANEHGIAMLFTGRRCFKH